MQAHFSRRGLLKAGCAALGGLVLPPSAVFAEETTRPSGHVFKVGDAEVTVLSDGSMSLPQSFVLPDRDPPDVDRLFAPATPSFAMAVNITMIRIGRRVVLVDCGGGTDFMPEMGRFPDILSELGISPDEITDVVFTHAHPDHFWGIIDPFENESRFPNAAHFMTAPERDFWLQPGVETRVADGLQGVALGTQRRLDLLKERISICAPDREIAPGLRVVDTAGHTPGHVSLHLESEGEALFVSGDVVSHPIVSFARPDWRWGSDMDADKGIATRKKILDMLSHDRIALLGYHLPWPGIGLVERRGAAYRFAQG